MASKRPSDGDTKSTELKKNVGFWKNGLKTDMLDPLLQVFADDKIIVIKDKYPKAKYHFLVLPRKDIPNLKALTKEHVELVQHMRTQGEIIANNCKSADKFRYGYHAIPSMSQVHLHVISQDFVSDSLKTKRHWNSFTTDYFVDSDDLVRQLRDNGKYSSPPPHQVKAFLDLPLRCHRCELPQPSMPKLKLHLLTHLTK